MSGRIARLATAALASAPLLACSEPATPPAGPIELELVGELVRPDTTTETSWIGRSLDLTYDPASGHLFAINLDERFVFEVDPAGGLVRTYGKQGEGPGELENPLDILVEEDSLLVLNLGNMKLVRFPRNGDTPLESRLDNYYYDVAHASRDELLALPGWDSTAVTVLDREGRTIEGFGRRSWLTGYCTGCLLAVLPNGGKVWISDIEVLDDSNLLLALSPANPLERGRELWRISLTRDVITRYRTRYRWNDPPMGADIAVNWPSIYSTSLRDGAIREYRVPAAGWDRVAETGRDD